MPLKVLHVSDLLVSAENAEEVSGYFKDLFRQEELFLSVDYLVVCGNLTAGAQFLPQLGRVLDALRECLLKEHEHLAGNRILVLPGRLDADDPASAATTFLRFAEFYKSYFEPYKIVQPFDPEKPIFRHLRDLTLIGVLHMNPDSPPRQITEEPHELISLLARRVGSAPNRLPYVGYQPCLLATVDTPLLHWELLAHAEREEIQTGLKRIDIHLFGADRVTYLPSEPFAFGHAHLGTGPRIQGQQWPVRANVLKLGKYVDETDSSRIALEATAYKKVSPEGPWRSHKIVGPGVSTVKPDAPEESFLHDSFLGKLRASLNAPVVRVTGFSGSWPSEVAARLAACNGSLGEGRIPIRLSPLSSYTAAPEFLAELREQLARNLEANPHKSLLFIVTDTAFRNMGSEPTDPCYQFRKSLHGLAQTKVHFIHLLEAYDLSLPSLPGEIEIVFPPLDPASFQSLTRLYSRKLPITFRTSSMLTRGYFDFTVHLFRCLSEEFGSRPGPITISNEDDWELFEAVLSRQSPWNRILIEDSGNFMDQAKNTYGGKAITKHLSEQYAESYGKDGDLRKLASDAVTFSVAKLSDNVGKQRQFAETANLLAQFGIFERTDNETFSVREKLPFLLDALHGRQLQRRGYAFLSYANAEEEIVRPIRDKLQGDGNEVWWDRDFILGQYRKAIEDKLTKAACVVVIWSKLSKGRSWVLDEADYANKTGRLVSILCGITAEEIPVGFRQVQAYRHDDPDSYLEAVRILMARQ